MRRRGWLVTVVLASIPKLVGAGTNTWTGGYPGATAPAATLIASDPSTPSVVYAAFDSDLYRSTDGGRSWARLGSLTDYKYDHALSLFVSPASSPSTLFIGLESGLLRSTDNGASWTQTLQEAITVLAAQPSDPTVLYAGTIAGTVWRGSNDGAAWTNAGHPSTTGGHWNRQANAIASLLFGDRDDGSLYAAGGYDLATALDYGYGVGWALMLGKSADFGATWTDLGGAFPLEDELYVNDLVAGSSAHELFAAMGNAKPDRRLAHSTDGGSTWDRGYVLSFPGSADLHRLTVDPDRPGTLYAATSEGIYRTTDDGRTWQAFGQSLRGQDVSTLVLGGRTLHAGGAFGAFDLDLREGAVDVSAGATGTHLLSWNADRLSVRTLQESGDSTETPPEGPFAGWTAVAIAEGTDGKSRVLWVNGDGRAGLEVVGTGGDAAAFRFPAQFGFSEHSPMSAVDVSVGDGGIAHLLWTNSLGAAHLSSVDSSGAMTYGPEYGPYSKWTAVAIADGPGLTWVLWRATDGRVSLSLHRALEMQTVVRFAASPSWAAEDLTVGADGWLRLLRVNPDGRAEVSTVDTLGRITASHVYVNPGFAPWRIAAGPDGLTRLLWGSSDGRESVFLLNADNTQHQQEQQPPPPSPAGGDLSGDWTGVLTFSEACWDRVLNRSCLSPADVEATLAQSASAVTGHLTAGCSGTLTLGGTLYRGVLKIALVKSDGSELATVSGAADPLGIDVGSGDLCDPWGYDSTIRLQLTRRHP